MNERKSATVVFDRDVRYSKLMELIPSDFDGTIVINGELIADMVDYSEKDAVTCKCIYVGSVSTIANPLQNTDLVICGSLVSYGNIWADYIYVKKELICFGNLCANILNADEGVLAIGNVEIY